MPVTINGTTGLVGVLGVEFIQNPDNPNTGLFFPATDTVTIGTNDVERMRFTANGNIGIGNTTPAHTLRVQGDISLSGGIHANGSLGTAGQVLSSNSSGVYWSNLVASFEALSDTPSSYLNTSGFVVTVNDTETGLVFSNQLQTELERQAAITNLILMGS